jgi:hypothetical protein
MFCGTQQSRNPLGLVRGKLGRSKQRPYQVYSVVQGGIDFGIGDGAFADYVPVVAVEADDGARQGAAGVACVEDQGEAVA